MLLHLHIQNYAIIHELRVDFTPGLTIITGETGAGKSIIMGALGLVLGDRADSAVLPDTQKKSLVEAGFTADAAAIQSFLQEQELDIEPILLIRREISANGKSRAFINDTPVNLTQLKQVALLLVDLHQQFDTLELANLDFQREVLDALANNNALLLQYRQGFVQYQQQRQRLDQLVEAQAAANKELDYQRYLFEELETAAFKADELEDLDAEIKLLSNAEQIKVQLEGIAAVLHEGEQPLVQTLKVLANKLQPFTMYHPTLPVLAERLLAMQVELKDIAAELVHCNDGILYDPQRLQEVSDRMATGYKLLKKHGVQTTGELLAIQEDLSVRLDAVVNLAQEIAQTEKEMKNLLAVCEKRAAELHTRREKAILPFTEQVNTLLARIGMPNARLKVLLQPVALHSTGSDQVQFLFDANRSDRFEALGRVASGGELSRLMLCIKSLVAQQLELPTLIFDEIDTGISGEAARQVGQVMKELATGRQVIAITHQPQIAARADAHFFVYKENKDGRITTGMRLLTADERIRAIAQMLGGEQPTAAALENAREMVNN
jgi:DNA repair protein RecN (Recombination protein N)